MTWEATIPNLPFNHAKTWKIVASAGCGKSFQIAKTIKELVFEQNVHPSKIMYIVFNKKPAQDFKEELAAQGISDGTDWIGTHHSICRRLLNIGREKILVGSSLKEWGSARGFSFGEDDEQNTEWDSIMSSMERKIYDDTNNFDPYERMLLDALLKSEAEEGLYTHTRYLAACLKKNLFPSEVEYVFVDEAQDNAKIQFDYFRHVIEHRSIKGMMLVGDDKQAINAYKGGRHDLFLEFCADRYVCLPKTYRNCQEVLLFANSIAEPIQERSPLTTETNNTTPGSIIEVPSFEYTIPAIADALRCKKSVMVLTRNRIYKNMAIDSLTESGLFVLSKKMKNVLNTFKKMQALNGKTITYQDIASLFVLNPEDGDIKKTAYAKRGVITKFLKGDYSEEKDPDLYIEYYLSQQDDYPVCVEEFGISSQLIEDIKKTKDGYIPRNVFAGVSEAEIMIAEDHIRTNGIDSSTVVASVIHPIKGGEADIVVLLKNITGAVEENERTDIDSERRVWYVAATRAREAAYITSLQLGPRQKLTCII